MFSSSMSSLYIFLAAPSDYTRATTKVTFSPGSFRVTMSLFIVDDNITELTESFTAQLSNLTGAQLGARTATIIIEDDDSKARMKV